MTKALETKLEALARAVMRVQGTVHRLVARLDLPPQADLEQAYRALQRDWQTLGQRYAALCAASQALAHTLHRAPLPGDVALALEGLQRALDDDTHSPRQGDTHGSITTGRTADDGGATGDPPRPRGTGTVADTAAGRIL